MNQSLYFMAPIQVSDRAGLRMYASRAMISQQGIYRLFEESEAIHQAFLETRNFTVLLEGAVLTGRLVREQGAEGTHYNLRFINVREESARRLAEQLRRSGFASPWKRQFPRIPVGKVPAHVEVPVTVAFPKVVGQSAGEVANFSQNGMFFEIVSHGRSLGEFVGQCVEFHLITSNGMILPDVEAKVAKIYDEMDSPARLVRGLGVKFTHFKLDAQKIYQGMILQASRELARKRQENSDGDRV